MTNGNGNQDPDLLDEEIEDAILTRLMYLNSTLVGIVTGLILGIGIFLATNILILKGGPVVGPHLALLGQYFIGYKVTFLGSLIGLGYGFVTGFIVGYCISRLYNWFAAFREKKHG